MSDQIELLELDYHRNGVTGAGFWAARINWTLEGGEARPFRVVHFPDGEVHTAVLAEDVDTIEFGHNSWRPEAAHDFIVKAVAVYWQARDKYEEKTDILGWYKLSIADKAQLVVEQMGAVNA